MNLKLINYYGVVPFIIVVLLSYDTYPYFKSLKSIQTYSYQKLIEKEIESIEADLSLYTECNNIKINNTLSTKKDTILYRNCINSNITKMKSLPGTLVFSGTASNILINNPKDKELRNNSLLAIDLARINLISTKPHKHDLLDNINKAHDKSIFLSLIHGKKFTESFFNVDIKYLDKAENYIVSPDIIMKQNYLKKGVI